MPDYLHYTLTLKDGRVYEGQLGQEIQKVRDIRNGVGAPVTAFDVRTKFGIIIRVWPDELAKPAEGELRNKRFPTGYNPDRR